MRKIGSREADSPSPLLNPPLNTERKIEQTKLIILKSVETLIKTRVVYKYNWSIIDKVDLHSLIFPHDLHDPIYIVFLTSCAASVHLIFREFNLT